MKTSVPFSLGVGFAVVTCAVAYSIGGYIAHTFLLASEQINISSSTAMALKDNNSTKCHHSSCSGNGLAKTGKHHTAN